MITDDGTFDGESECPDCGVMICAYCQGTAYDESECTGRHLVECPRLQRILSREQNRTVVTHDPRS